MFLYFFSSQGQNDTDLYWQIVLCYCAEVGFAGMQCAIKSSVWGTNFFLWPTIFCCWTKFLHSVFIYLCARCLLQALFFPSCCCLLFISFLDICVHCPQTSKVHCVITVSVASVRSPTDSGFGSAAAPCPEGDGGQISHPSGCNSYWAFNL